MYYRRSRHDNTGEFSAAAFRLNVIAGRISYLLRLTFRLNDRWFRPHRCRVRELTHTHHTFRCDYGVCVLMTMVCGPTAVEGEHGKRQTTRRRPARSPFPYTIIWCTMWDTFEMVDHGCVRARDSNLSGLCIVWVHVRPSECISCARRQSGGRAVGRFGARLLRVTSLKNRKLVYDCIK